MGLVTPLGGGSHERGRGVVLWLPFWPRAHRIVTARRLPLTPLTTPLAFTPLPSFSSFLFFLCFCFSIFRFLGIAPSSLILSTQMQNNYFTFSLVSLELAARPSHPPPFTPFGTTAVEIYVLCFQFFFLRFWVRFAFLLFFFVLFFVLKSILNSAPAVLS